MPEARLTSASLAATPFVAIDRRLAHHAAVSYTHRGFFLRRPKAPHRRSNDTLPSPIPAMLTHAKFVIAVTFTSLAIFVPRTRAADPVRPWPRFERLVPIEKWHRSDDWRNWKALHDCRLEVEGNRLVIHSSGTDPYLVTSVNFPKGHYRVTVHLANTDSLPPDFSVYWATRKESHFDESRHVFVRPSKKRRKGIAVLEFEADAPVTALRIDPMGQPGRLVLESVTVERVELFPVILDQVRQHEDRVDFDVRNASDQVVEFRNDGTVYRLESGQLLTITRPIAGRHWVDDVALQIELADWPVWHTAITALAPRASQPHWNVSCGGFEWRVSRDGSAVFIYDGDILVAALAPLVRKEGQVVRGNLLRSTDRSWYFERGSVQWSIELAGDECRVQVRDERAEVEGPVVRSWGELEQGLFAGLEFLGKGERSSSKLDIETEGHVRFAPDPLCVTMPLMSFVTSRVSVALTWNGTGLQPVYATPDFFDGTAGHRMALRGKVIDACVRLNRQRLTDAIAWCVQRHGLPRLPKFPLSPRETRQLDLKGLESVAGGEGRWRHARGPRWGAAPFADMASTYWHLTGKVPPGGPWQVGGAHIPNEAIFFVTGQVDRWKASWKGRVRQAIREQGADGLYRYRGKYARGHFEDTASGYCAKRAVWLLEWAYYTGDPEALAAGRKSLDAMTRFRTPRGAQTWECPLHTPDLLAAAHLVHAYVRGYQLTGHEPYLKEARRWALSGVPFVYLWGDQPVMPYATIAVYGATNWRAPNWIGLPVQWVGTVYARALTMLAPYDQTLDWNRLARGIYLCGRQMQYLEGPSIGLLPDSFDLASQTRRPPDINPCALASLQRLFEGHGEVLTVITIDGHRVVGPFPMVEREGKLIVTARSGIRYQLVVDGERVLSIDSKGRDVVSLE